MTIARGEIWLVDLDPGVGDEIRKRRPALVVSSDAVGVLALRVIVPVTAWQDQFSVSNWLIRIDPDGPNGLSKSSTADTFQVRSISTRRFHHSVGLASDADLQRVLTGLKAVFVM